MYSTTAHTYGHDCYLQPESNTFTRRASTVSVDAPPIRAQWCYSSPLPIDDPLSPVPPPSTKSSTPSKVPPRPFSVADNRALEEAWQGLQKVEHGDLGTKRSKTFPERDVETQQEAPDVESNEPKQGRSRKASAATLLFSTSVHRRNDTVDAAEQGSRSPQVKTDPHLVLCDDPQHIPFDASLPINADEISQDEFEGAIPKKHRNPFHRHEKPGKIETDGQSLPTRSLSRHFKRPSTDAPYGSSPSERDTTGTPFLRVASRLRSRSRQRQAPGGADGVSDDDLIPPSRTTSRHIARSDDEADSATQNESDMSSPGHRSKVIKRYRRSMRKQKELAKITIPVGISRLHLVEMPSLKMGPIYWDPVHDVSSVMRGTWFYKETMLPVPSDVANQLEEGYEYMKPWTPTYTDELNSCLEIGPEAETKIVHRLWPDPSNDSRPTTAKSRKSLLATPTDKLTSDERAQLRAIGKAGRPENRAAGVLEDEKDSVEKRYARCSVIYANAKDAQILRPNQLPSVGRGRRPLGPIRKGRAIGDPVVRGFDHKTWEKLHPPPVKKRESTADKANLGVEAMKASPSRAPSISQKTCTACASAEDRPKPTDLILVIHGIGQKLSERVESFHFTHAINAFRRQINVELESASVQPWLRQDLGGIMVLPINWRSTLKLEEGGPRPNPNHKDETSSQNQFTLKDITADSIPAVRNLISDVMLDIPYYLSHHKPKMIEAVVREANRVYRLWCKNNPGFEEAGKVHLIAHSLGSVMALDILSKQPTEPPKLDLVITKPRTDIFEFDTKSLFFCGSPAGFFLLLNKAPLLPRKGRKKSDSDDVDTSPGVAGEAGTYGCLAVNNLYNVLHYNDPIAYRLNACVDVDYAYSLQPARVPSATSTWAQYFGSAFRSKPIAPTIPILPGNTDMASRPTMNRLPTTVEMETHDFTQEELAEKRMLLLNDNGQIDFTLQSGGGPLEIQYLNMLSAHSSYWILKDFIRFLVIEIGRKQGKEAVLPAVKASKKVWGKK